MAWAVSSDLEEKARTARTLCVMPFRRFGPSECAKLCRVLADNTSLTELLASGHAVGREGAVAIGELLGRTECGIRVLALGDTSFGREGVAALVQGLGDSRCRLHSLDLELKACYPPALALLCAVFVYPSTPRLRCGTPQSSS
jgi:hypothetical protein